jgi:hypothetical protein
MLAEPIQHVLSALGTYGSVADTWVRGPCPLAPWRHTQGTDSHPSFGVSIRDDAKSLAKCWTCDFVGDVFDLVLAVRAENKITPRPNIDLRTAREIAQQDGTDIVLGAIDYDAQIASLAPKAAPGPIPPEWIASFASAWSVDAARDYLLSRYVSEDLALKCNARWDSTRDRVCFPIVNQTGQIRGLQGRTIHADVEPRYYMYNHPGKDMNVWYNANQATLEAPVVVTEGVFDALSIMRVYPNTLAGLMATVSPFKMRFLRDAVHIVTLYDIGKGGSVARDKMSTFCQSHGIVVTHVLPDTDAGNATVEDLEEWLSVIT